MWVFFVKFLNIDIFKVVSINQIIKLDKVKYRKLDLHNVHSCTFCGNNYCLSQSHVVGFLLMAIYMLIHNALTIASI